MTNRLNKITTEEDIETFAGGSIWRFEYYTKDREEAMGKVIQAINILIEAKLLSRRMGFYDGEMTSDLGEESVAKFIRKNMIKDDFIGFMYGDTTVYLPVDSYPGPKRSADMRNVIEVDFSYSSEVVDISVSTSSSIWLPFNFKGRPHIDVYALNLNRLSSVLVKIEALGLELANDSHSHDKRCIDSGYLLENYAVNDKSFKYNELENYIEDNDDIYGVSRTNWPK